MTRILLLSVLSAALVACTEPEPRTSASPEQSTTPVSFVEGCEAFFTKARECTNEYIPALVDLRIEYDKPAGIAAHAQTEGRDAVIAKAMEEWAEDSQPAAIRANCERLAPNVSPEHVESMRAAAEACVASTDCAAFGACSKELQRDRIANQP